MTAVFFYGWEPYETSGTSIDVSFTVFTDLRPNDALVVHLIAQNNATNFVTPSGWQLMAVSPGIAAGAVASFYRDADGTETSQTFTWDVSQDVLAFATLFTTSTVPVDVPPLMWGGVVTHATTGTTHDTTDVVPVWPCSGASDDDAIHLVIGQAPGPTYDDLTHSTGMTFDAGVDHTNETVCAGLYNRFADSDGTYDPGPEIFVSSKDRFSVAFAIRVRCTEQSYLGMLAYPI